MTAEINDTTQPDLNAEIARLAALPPLEYDRERDAAAKKLSVRVSTLDDEIKKLRKSDSSTVGQGRMLTFDEPAPWDQKVDGEALLDEITAAIKSHVILPDKGAEAVALWDVMTYGVDIFDCLPRLYIHSPEKECGKTTLLNCVSRQVWRSLPASSISTASTFRVIEQVAPTLCLDESDTFFRENLELRGVVNSGHTRATAFVIRTVGEDHEPRQFSTFTPIAIAGIGRIHDTTESRSIIIPMRRKKKGEKVKKLRDREREPFSSLARKIRRWVNDNRNKLAECNPAMPDELGDRAADNWHTLLAIADTAGGLWPELARQVAVTLSAGKNTATTSHGTQLLADIKTIFDTRNADKIPSKEMAEALVAMEGHPWAEHGKHRKAITQNTLARLLVPFDIMPGTIRTSDKDTPKGYKLDQFSDVWERYLSSDIPNQTATTPQGAENQGSPADSEVQHEDGCGGSEIAENLRLAVVCGGVADGNTSSWETEL